jgi:hypothetical protein
MWARGSSTPLWAALRAATAAAFATLPLALLAPARCDGERPVVAARTPAALHAPNGAVAAGAGGASEPPRRALSVTPVVGGHAGMLTDVHAGCVLKPLVGARGVAEAAF